MIQNAAKPKVRDSSMELLRIIAMLMIVFHHFAAHGGFLWESSVTATRFWYNFILMGGKIGSNVFIMISGYYLINSRADAVGLERTLKLIGQVFFYSAGLFVIAKLSGVPGLGLKPFIKACFPITFAEWWFVSAYFVLYLIHPFLNKLLHCLDRQLYRRLLLLLFVCWSVIPTFTGAAFQGSHLLWFVSLYSLAGYIRLFGLNSKHSAKHYFAFFLVCSALTYLSSAVFTILGSKWAFFEPRVHYFYAQEKLPTFISSVCLFMIFTSLKLGYHKWINVIASASFGVYLIHDNDFVRKFLWVDLFNNLQYQYSLFLIPYSIMVVVAVYAACSCIDILRQNIIEKPFLKLVRRCSQKKITPPKLFIKLKDFVFGE